MHCQLFSLFYVLTTVLTSSSNTWLQSEQSIVVNQVTHELLSYDAMADGPYQHTWWFNDFSGQWEKTVFFPAATTGMDTNTTIDVSICLIYAHK